MPFETAWTLFSAMSWMSSSSAPPGVHKEVTSLAESLMGPLWLSVRYTGIFFSCTALAEQTACCCTTGWDAVECLFVSAISESTIRIGLGLSWCWEWTDLKEQGLQNEKGLERMTCYQEYDFQKTRGKNSDWKVKWTSWWGESAHFQN